MLYFDTFCDRLGFRVWRLPCLEISIYTTSLTWAHWGPGPGPMNKLERIGTNCPKLRKGPGTIGLNRTDTGPMTQMCFGPGPNGPDSGRTQAQIALSPGIIT